MEERICTIPLRDAYMHVRQKRGKRAVIIVRKYVARHMKVEEGNVRISAGVNSAILAGGIQQPPRRIKVKLVLDKEGIATAWMTEEQAKLDVKKKQLEEKRKVSEERAKKNAEARAKKAPAKAEEKKAQAPAAKPEQAQAAKPATQTATGAKLAEAKAQTAGVAKPGASAPVKIEEKKQ